MAQLRDLPSTGSGHVPKHRAIEWLERPDSPSEEDVATAFVPKPRWFTGSEYPTPISDVRLVGELEYVETMAGPFTPVLALENDPPRLYSRLQAIEDHEPGELTDDYALYLSVTERG